MGLVSSVADVFETEDAGVPYTLVSLYIGADYWLIWTKIGTRSQCFLKRSSGTNGSKRESGDTYYAVAWRWVQTTRLGPIYSDTERDSIHISALLWELETSPELNTLLVKGLSNCGNVCSSAKNIERRQYENEKVQIEATEVNIRKEDDTVYCNTGQI